MTTGRMNRVFQNLRRAVLRRDGAGLTDGQLLEGFIGRRDEDAFEALVRRHGPMVMGVCRRVLGHPQDAEDAFQATFLVLVRKAPSIAARELLAGWLYGVAYHTALRARTATGRRRRRERPMAQLPEPEVFPPERWDDLQALLDQELSRLPDRYRLPILLCDLESKSHKQAAAQLGWPTGTLSGRLVRARALLARRLTQRGVALSGAALALALANGAAAGTVPAALVGSTVKAAGWLAAGHTAAPGLIPAKVAILTEGVIKAMLLNKLGTVTAGALLAAVLAVGTGFFLAAAPADGVQPAREKEAAPQAVERTTAVDLASIYHTNDALGDEKFTGKRVRVTGHMFRVKRATGDRKAYWMEMNPMPAAMMVPIILEFDVKARKQLARIEVNQQATVEGRCEGRTRVAGHEAILFIDCTLVRVEPMPQGMMGGGGGPAMNPFGPRMGGGPAGPMGPARMMRGGGGKGRNGPPMAPAAKRPGNGPAGPVGGPPVGAGPNGPPGGGGGGGPPLGPPGGKP
jgi:RNA polymerase sigma factor (sigma-70 family)